MEDKYLLLANGGAFGTTEAIMSKNSLGEFLTANCETLDQDIEIILALDKDFYWRGSIGPLAVLIVGLDYINTLLD